LPAEWADNPRHDPIERRVADYIAGMTDRYAIVEYRRLFAIEET
jgi:dGTPase